MTYDGTYGETDKVLAFIQQFDAAFGGETFDEASKLRHVAMYVTKSGRKWWSKLQMEGEAPTTWKSCRQAIMKQFLTSHAQDDVIAEWHGLHMEKGEPIKKYIDRFWDLNLKACVFEDIGFKATKSQYCAGLPVDMRAYINAQNPKTISEVIHHSMLAHKIFSNKEEKRAAEKGTKMWEKTEKHDKNDGGKKAVEPKKKDKGPYKGPNRLTPEQLESYR